MNKGMTDVVAYLSWPGLIIALLFGDRMGSRFHLNQSLAIWLAATLISVVARHTPLIGWAIGGVGGLFCAACWFIGVVAAVQGQDKEVPVLGQLKIL